MSEPEKLVVEFRHAKSAANPDWPYEHRCTACDEEWPCPTAKKAATDSEASA